jgi:hypothetical protein
MLGKTLAELDAQMDSRELTQWAAYLEVTRPKKKGQDVITPRNVEEEAAAIRAVLGGR